MTDQLASPSIANPFDDQASDPELQQRIHLDGRRAPSSHIDGAWWPRSTQLADELPDLFATVHESVGPVALVGYRHDGWTDAPPQITTAGGQSVELLGFDSDEPPTVIVIGQNGHHLMLRVIAPVTDEEEARRALDAVPDGPVGPGRGGWAASTTIAGVAKKLAEHQGRNDPERDAEIARWCDEATSQFDDVRIQSFVPILVEHIVNNRIHEARRASAASPPH